MYPKVAHNLKKVYLLFLDAFNKPDINFALFLGLEEREKGGEHALLFTTKERISL